MEYTLNSFVDDLIGLFPMREYNAAQWAKQYAQGLREMGNLDFTKLWKIFRDEYMSTVTPPSVKWLKDAAKRARVKDKKQKDALDDAQTVTAVIGSGIYEFVVLKGQENEANEILSKADFFWQGKAIDPPDEYKAKIKKLREDFKNDWMRTASSCTDAETSIERFKKMVGLK